MSAKDDPILKLLIARINIFNFDDSENINNRIIISIRNNIIITKITAFIDLSNRKEIRLLVI